MDEDVIFVASVATAQFETESGTCAFGPEVDTTIAGVAEI